MSKKISDTDLYVNSIIEDVQTRFVSEETIIYSDTEIERNYEFEDGAIVRYEWRSGPGKAADEKYNHRFTLSSLPKPNPKKIKKGVIRMIGFGKNAR